MKKNPSDEVAYNIYKKTTNALKTQFKTQFGFIAMKVKNKNVVSLLLSVKRKQMILTYVTLCYCDMGVVSR